MGLRFRKSIKLAPGVRINISKSGISTTIGKKGASVSLGKNGTYANLGIPGTGISVREKLSEGSSSSRSSRSYSTLEDVSTPFTSTFQEKPISLTPSEWFWGIIGMIVWWGGIIAACYYCFRWIFS